MNSNLELIYGKKTRWYYNRKQKLVEYFRKSFDEEPTNFFSSPGRIEILGNHTDHNNGLVMVSAIDLDIFACIRKRNDNCNKSLRHRAPSHRPIEPRSLHCNIHHKLRFE